MNRDEEKDNDQPVAELNILLTVILFIGGLAIWIWLVGQVMGR